MTNLIIVICFVVLLYAQSQIMKEILMLRADVKYLVNKKSLEITKELIKDYYEGQKQ